MEHSSAHGGKSAVVQSVDELAEVLGVSRQSAYSGLRRGEIPSIRINKRFIIPRAAIEAWLKTAGGHVAA